MSVRTDLEKATGLKINKDEDVAAFKLRLIEAMSDEDMDDEYKAMPAESRKWYNKAVKSYQANKKLSALPEFPEDAEEEDQEEETAEAEEETEETAEEAEAEADEEDSDAETGDDEVTHTDVSESTGRKGYRSKTSSKAKAKAAAPTPKAKSKKAAPAKRKGDDGGGKGLNYARKLLAKDITMSATDLRDKVKNAGYEVSDKTLSTGASGFRAAVRALQTAGKLKSTMLED